MSWDQLQQVIRILLYALGGWALGDAVTSGADFQNAVSGVLAVGSFAWWFFWDRKRSDTTG